MTPEQSMRIYLAECSLHAQVLLEGAAILNSLCRFVKEYIAAHFSAVNDISGESIRP